ncbi:MAG: hypothetical protein R2794_09595 [Chitinophagales bacterium]
MSATIHPDKRILVIGSLNANPLDREIKREDIRSMQLIDEKHQITPVAFFNAWGELGMSSMCWHPEDPYTLYLASSSALFRFDLKGGKYTDCNIPNLTDIHEISMIGKKVWISNTKHDEIVSYDITTQSVDQRINLSDFKSNTPEEGEGEADTEVVDKFHCNLVFEGYEGDLYILVHHTSGRQLMKRIAQKFIKSQGNGGVVDITKRRRYPLNFKAPHSVRKIQDQYWVFDSGHFQLKIYDKNWNYIRSIDTKGFGRGGDVDMDLQVYYGGVSETRKRYLGLFPGGEAVPNQVQVVSLSQYKIISSIAIPNIEQINNVYCLQRDVAELLLQFSG